MADTNAFVQNAAAAIPEDPSAFLSIHTGAYTRADGRAAAHYGFSALTLVFFLSALPADEAAELLQEFRRKVDRDKQNNAT